MVASAGLTAPHTSFDERNEIGSQKSLSGPNAETSHTQLTQSAHFAGRTPTSVATSSNDFTDMESDKLHLDVSSAQREVVAWFRDGALEGEPLFMLGQTEHALGERTEELAKRILSRVRTAGFDLEVKPVQENGHCAFHSYWRFRGHDLVGFKQAPTASTEAEATVLACAALLRNEWCRSRLS